MGQLDGHITIYLDEKLLIIIFLRSLNVQNIHWKVVPDI